ncbi:hypothetical protein OLMES_2002 [Oleiphilus messinensis]|uniref:Uncharacterized protein n=1 Tax=Oleiphilus messinensis TaxID=141451 RepID=A0A1Y0I8H9_9GAMM|nr:hypothetical protein OLMES_2002 [Oleiphilus messinensis]
MLVCVRDMDLGFKYSRALADPDGHVWEETFFRDEKKGCENHSLVISKVIYRFPGKKRTSSETLING